MNKLVVFVFIVVCLIWIVSSNYVKLYTDKIVTFAATTTSQSRSPVECALACQINYPCVSYSYHSGRAQCYLYDRIIHPADATNADAGLQTYTHVFGKQNIAFLKPTAQGSTYDGHQSYKGVDGLKYSAMFHTNVNAWWCVDLSNVYELKWLAMYNVFDQPVKAGRLPGFEIWLAASGGCTQTGFTASRLCYKDTNSAELNIYTINNCSEPSTQFDARYVFIYQPTSVLHLYQVEIIPW